MSNPSIEYKASLSERNTFGMKAEADCLVTLTEDSQIPLLNQETTLPLPLHVLGGGSNILIKGSVKGSVILNRIKGIDLVNEDAEFVVIKVGAGEIWQEFVEFAISKNWGGIENLSLIPGTVGAAPIQNIGAYGVEVKDTIQGVTGWDLGTNQFRTFTNTECCFGYRDSIFKGPAFKDQFIITAVYFQLRKHPVLNTGYGSIREELERLKLEPDVRSVSQAVINIRKSKLPDPAILGNAGSFFKNPSIPESEFLPLKEKYPDMPSFSGNEGLHKIPAAWLIEQCGWKGYRRGNIGVHVKQALVLVNYGGGTGAEIWELSGEIIQSILERFGILLEREVQVW